MEVPSRIRKLFLESPDNFRRAIITDNQVSVLKLIKSRGMSISSREFADIRGLSVQNASGQLAKLVDKGYLRTEQHVDPSGGIYYRYYPTL